MYVGSVTSLHVRRVPFDFDRDVPFCWQPDNPEFALSMNLISLMIIGFEKYIVDAVRAATPRIKDDAVASEADAFLRHEAQHARAHRMHTKALARQYPGLSDVVDAVVHGFDVLFAARPLEYHLADVEATFTPTFKQLLDHADELFRPGDERVASLFLWHFTEEIEHRSSALIVFDHVVGQPWYRLRKLPSVLRHIANVTKLTTDGINRCVPLEDRKVDARNILPGRQVRGAIGEKLPFVARGIHLSYPAAKACVPATEQLAANFRMLASQSPHHDPQHQPLPPFAAEWIARYDREENVSRWFSSQPAD